MFVNIFLGGGTAFVFGDRVYYSVDLAVLELALPPGCWDHRHALLLPACNEMELDCGSFIYTSLTPMTMATVLLMKIV